MRLSLRPACFPVYASSMLFRPPSRPAASPVAAPDEPVFLSRTYLTSTQHSVVMVGLLYDAGTLTQQEAPCFARRTNESNSPAAGSGKGFHGSQTTRLPAVRCSASLGDFISWG